VFLYGVKDYYSWQFYQDFYTDFNQVPGFGWRFLRERFSDAAGEDVNDIFDEWQLPNK